MSESFRHLNLEGRARVQASLKLGLSVRAISRELKHSGWRGSKHPACKAA